MSRAPDVRRWVDQALGCGYNERNTDGRPARYWITQEGRDYLCRLVCGLRIESAPALGANAVAPRFTRATA